MILSPTKRTDLYLAAVFGKVGDNAGTLLKTLFMGSSPPLLICCYLHADLLRVPLGRLVRRCFLHPT